MPWLPSSKLIRLVYELRCGSSEESMETLTATGNEPDRTGSVQPSGGSDEGRGNRWPDGYAARCRREVCRGALGRSFSSRSRVQTNRLCRGWRANRP